MSIESERLEDELRFIVCAFREGLLWQRTCGASGLPAAPPSRKNTAPAFDAPIRNEQQGKASGGVESSKGSSSSIDSSPALPVADRLNLSVEQRLARLSDVATQIKTCERCGLCRGRKNVVYGTGAIDVDIMIVGEGPGVEEDLQGIPFVGKAGQLLDKMLAAMGYARSQVYIGNVVKCRPPNNRVPEDDEIGACMPYLREQVELVQPKVMVAMGGTAVRGLFGLGGITRVRGRWKLYQGKIPVMPTFHPAYLLRNESAKREVWDDLKQVLRHLNREVPKREK